MLYSSGGRPATALSPMFGITFPSNSQTSIPSRWTLFGAASFHLSGRWSSNRVGGSTTWSSTLTRIMSSVRMASPVARVHLTSMSGWARLVLRGDGVGGDVHLRDVLGGLDVARDGVVLGV